MAERVVISEAELTERLKSKHICCTCGNLIKIGPRGIPFSERVYLEHPACGREPSRIFTHQPIGQTAVK